MKEKLESTSGMFSMIIRREKTPYSNLEVTTLEIETLPLDNDFVIGVGRLLDKYLSNREKA